jgi:hypothetical protein
MNEEKLEIELPKVDPLYSFDWIMFALGLIPILDGEAAINPISIIDFVRAEDGPGWILNLEHGESFNLDHEDMAELQDTLKRRIEEQKAKQKDAMKDQIRMQAEAMAELQGGVVPGAIVPAGKKWRQ